MKVIFLDFDGVLVTRASVMQGLGVVNNDCVLRLNGIVKLTGARLVISSSWRKRGLPFIQELLNNWGVKAEVVGVTPIIPEANRGKEIRTWLAGQQGITLRDFCILDDERDLGEMTPWLVPCDFETGLTPLQVQQCLYLLGYS